MARKAPHELWNKVRDLEQLLSDVRRTIRAQNTLISASADVTDAEKKRAEKAEAALVRIQAVVEHQTSRGELGRTFHPLTCGADSRHAMLFPSWDGEKVILICPDCEYTQDIRGEE